MEKTCLWNGQTNILNALDALKIVFVEEKNNVATTWREKNSTVLRNEKKNLTPQKTIAQVKWMVP